MCQEVVPFDGETWIKKLNNVNSGMLWNFINYVEKKARSCFISLTFLCLWCPPNHGRFAVKLKKDHHRNLMTSTFLLGACRS